MKERARKIAFFYLKSRHRYQELVQEYQYLMFLYVLSPTQIVQNKKLTGLPILIILTKDISESKMVTLMITGRKITKEETL